MTSLVANASQLSPERATFIDTFSGSGRVYYKMTGDIDMTTEEFCKKFSESISIDIPGEGLYKSVSGNAYNLTIIPNNEYIHVVIEMMVSSHFYNICRNFINTHEYTPPRKSGVYDIDINHYYLDARGNTKIIEHNFTTEDFNHLIVEMYPDIDIDLMMRLYSESSESNMILTGQPGTGKTCFAKMMMAAHARHREYDIDVVYVKDRELLRKDEFWANMTSMRPYIIILDDLDDELRPRTEARNEIVNNMLSYSDGIFEVDTKIIITTNLTDNSIDKALIRPGRCFDILSLPQLTGSQAKTIWTETYSADESLFDELFGLNPKRISQAALASEYSRSIKCDNTKYLRNPNISIRKIVEEA